MGAAAKVVKSGGVIVHTEDEGSFTYLRGDTVPAKHAKLITNPAVWAGFDEPEDEEPADDSGDSGDGSGEPSDPGNSGAPADPNAQ